MEQYRTLKQEENERVLEYAIRFEKLWWFFWHFLTCEKRMIYLFVTGLTPDIKDFMSTSHMTTFDNTVEAAKLIEKENNRRLEERNNLNNKEEEEEVVVVGKGMQVNVVMVQMNVIGVENQATSLENVILIRGIGSIQTGMRCCILQVTLLDFHL